MVILFKKDDQDDAEEKKKINPRIFKKNSCFVNSYIRTRANGSNLCLKS
jgi:hypothetical protein